MPSGPISTGWPRKVAPLTVVDPSPVPSVPSLVARSRETTASMRRSPSRATTSTTSTTFSASAVAVAAARAVVRTPPCESSGAASLAGPSVIASEVVPSASARIDPPGTVSSSVTSVGPPLDASTAKG